MHACGQVADVQYRSEHELQRELVLIIDREHVHRLARGRPPLDVVDPGYLWGSGRGVVMSTCMHEAAYHSTSSTPDTCGEVGGAS